MSKRIKKTKQSQYSDAERMNEGYETKENEGAAFGKPRTHQIRQDAFHVTLIHTLMARSSNKAV